MSAPQKRYELRSQSRDENKNRKTNVKNPPVNKRNLNKKGILLPKKRVSDAVSQGQESVKNEKEINGKMSPVVILNKGNNIVPKKGDSDAISQRCFGQDVIVKTEPRSPVTLYSQLLALADKGGFITNTEEFDCIICMDTVGVGDGVRLRQCLHQFCHGCLTDVIMLSGESEVTCPFGDGKVKCNEALLDSEIRAILSPDDYEKHLKRSLRRAESTIKNSVHCKLADCDGWCICEDGVNQFSCPKCKSVNCVSCQAIHQGLDCQQYQNRVGNTERTQEYVAELIVKNEAMRCPNCQIVLMKISGCDWMQCSMCQTEICWATKQARWGPRGFNDITGGCRCKVDGKKCHPMCQNCH